MAILRHCFERCSGASARAMLSASLVARMSEAISGPVCERCRWACVIARIRAVAARRAISVTSWAARKLGVALQAAAPSLERRSAIVPIRCRDRHWDGRTHTFLARLSCAAPRPGDTISTENTATAPRNWILVILSSPHYRPIDMGRRRTRPASPRQHSHHGPNRRSRFGDPDLTERTAVDRVSAQSRHAHRRVSLGFP